MTADQYPSHHRHVFFPSGGIGIRSDRSLILELKAAARTKGRVNIDELDPSSVISNQRIGNPFGLGDDNSAIPSELMTFAAAFLCIKHIDPAFRVIFHSI